MFSALESSIDVAGAHVLDLYAGSGALGLEALSRGADAVTFVENDRKALDVLRQNVTTVGLPGGVVLAGTVESTLAGTATEPFDIVLADPPYAMAGTDLAVVLDRLAVNGWLAGHGILVLERAARDDEPTVPDGLTMLRQKRYGDTVTYWIGWTRAWE